MELTRLQPLPTKTSELRALAHEARRIAEICDEPVKMTLERLANDLAQIANRLDEMGSVSVRSDPP